MIRCGPLRLVAISGFATMSAYESAWPLAKRPTAGTYATSHLESRSGLELQPFAACDNIVERQHKELVGYKFATNAVQGFCPGRLKASFALFRFAAAFCLVLLSYIEDLRNTPFYGVRYGSMGDRHRFSGTNLGV